MVFVMLRILRQGIFIILLREVILMGRKRRGVRRLVFIIGVCMGLLDGVVSR